MFLTPQKLYAVGVNSSPGGEVIANAVTLVGGKCEVPSELEQNALGIEQFQ